jgi:outer membrane receptor for ferrienterochelin and colicins
MLRFIYSAAIAMALLFTSQTIFAQSTISGKVLSQSGEPLTGANIIVKNSTIGTASNGAGTYSLPKLKNGEYVIRVSFFGYGTVEKQVAVNDSDLNVDFALTQTSIDLNAVVVTGTRTEKSLANTPVLTQSITMQELQKKDITNIVDALEFTVPGLEFSSTAAGKSLSLQGIDAQYMLILVDGERLAGETYGDVDYSRINMADVERIEVVKGASSTLYGSNALGGVVNIITKNPVKELSASASARISRYNTQNQMWSFGTKQGKFSSQTSAVLDKTDGYDLIEGDSYRTQEKEDAVVVNEHLKYTPTESFVLEANASYMTKNRENTSKNLHDRRNENFTYGAKGTYFINTRNNLNLSWNSDNYKLIDKVAPNDLQTAYANTNNTARLLGDFKLAHWNQLTVGAEYVAENLTAARNKIEDRTNTDYIMYAQEDIQLGEKFDIIGGARALHNSQYGWHFTPQVSAMYKIWNFNLRGNYSLGYKTPTLKEKYMDFKMPVPGPPMYLRGNPDLEPETSTYTSLSAEYTRQGVSFSVSAYRNNIVNMISENDKPTVKPGGILEYQYLNYGEVLLKGIDIILRTKIVKSLYFNGAVTFSKKYDQIEDKEFDNARNFSGKFNLDYNLTSGDYRLDANIQSNVYGGKTINLMDEITRKVAPVELENFSLWKLTTTHTFKSRYYLKFGVDNILDYIDPSGGYNTGTPGRTLFFGVGLNI